jgi:16S rRNA (guanine(966)-N(2))-methyltransferase RsmD
MKRKPPRGDAKPDRLAQHRTTRPTVTDLKIIGGKFRGSKLTYAGDRRVRPMKHRVREAIFNLLGTEVANKHVFDLFAGTGALGLEALSRGAMHATFIEQHFPTARVIQKNIDQLDVGQAAEIIRADTFFWVEHRLEATDSQWMVFCCPPYDFYVERQSQILSLVQTMMDRAGDQSVVCVESDERFNFGLLPEPDSWDVRNYAPAVVGIWRKEIAEA